MDHDPESLPHAGSAARGTGGPDLQTQPSRVCPGFIRPRSPEGGHAEERAAGPGNPTLSPAKGNCGPAGSGRLKGALLLTSSGCVCVGGGGPICSLEHPHRTEERRAALETGTWLPGARGARGIR